MTESVTIIGAGLIGSLWSIYLAKHGYHVDIFERRPDMREQAVDAGRSINMAISERGIYSLKQVDIDNIVLKNAIPMKGRMIHEKEKDLHFLPYSVHQNEYIQSISRSSLNKILMTQAEQTEMVHIHFQHKAIDVDFENRTIIVENEQNNLQYYHQTDRVFACDGGGSIIRQRMKDHGGIIENIDPNSHGYKELMIPCSKNGFFQIEKNALHIWPRGNYMLIALPNPDASFTATLFLPLTGSHYSFESLDGKEKLIQFFQAEFSDAFELIEDLTHDFFKNPTGKLATVRASPWHYQDFALLLGDAAHAIVPFFGQGMVCGFEDCTILSSLMKQYDNDWEKIFADFGVSRKADTDAIADMAIENFYEMRDHVGDPQFRLKKGIEELLQKEFGEKYISRYALVSFRRVPYSLAYKIGIIQKEILDTLANGITDPNQYSRDNAKRLIDERLSEFIE